MNGMPSTKATSIEQSMLADSVEPREMKKGGQDPKVSSVLTALGAKSDCDESDSDMNEEQQPNESADKTKKSRREDDDAEDNIPMTFPQRLMEILSVEEHADVIAWLPHGRGFMIFHKKRFAEEILPKYFKRTKFTSFTRKLNRWNFTRITRGPETGAYYHECFQKGNLRLCMQMCCQSGKSPKPQHTGQPDPYLNPAMASRMNNAMSRLQITPQAMPAGLLAQGAPGVALDPNVMMLQQQLLMQQQQQAQQQQYAAMAGIPVAGTPYPGQQQPPRLLQDTSQTPASASMPTPVNNPASSTPASTPTTVMGSPDQSNMYSSGVVNAAIHALERSNQTNYLTMLLAQEKAQAQMAALGGPESMSRADLQRHQNNILLAQQQQFDLLTKQRMYQAAAASAQQQQQRAQQQEVQGQQETGDNTSATATSDKRAKAA